jgi:hypothetical protein
MTLRRLAEPAPGLLGDHAIAALACDGGARQIE